MDVELVGQLRSETGKGAARRLRSRQMVPAIVYGPKMESVSVAVSSKRMEIGRAHV